MKNVTGIFISNLHNDYEAGLVYPCIEMQGITAPLHPGGKIKLTKTSVREAMSLIPTDMVFYKDKDDKLYRLRYLKSAFEDYLSELDKLRIFVCISKYAPDILEGEIVQDSPAEVHVKAERGTYILQKNAEKIKFWDITEHGVNHATS